MDRGTLSHAGIAALPLFGDNRYWDPLFGAILRTLKKRKGSKFRGVVALSEEGADTSAISQLFNADGALHFCATENLVGLGSLATALLNEEVTGLLDIAKIETSERLLMNRVATIAGAPVLTVHSTEFPEVDDKYIRNFWTYLFASFSSRYGRQVDGVLNIYADGNLTLAAIAKNCKGVYDLETDGADGVMLWTSGLDDLRLRIHWPSGKGPVTLKLFGQAHEGVVGESIIVEFEGEQVREVVISDAKYGGIEFRFSGAGDDSLTSDLVIRFPKGYVPEPGLDGEGADDRRYAYLLYGVELNALRAMN